MGTLLYRQNNGMLCTYSTVTGEITGCNMSERMYVLQRMLAEKSRAEYDLAVPSNIHPLFKLNHVLEGRYMTDDQYEMYCKCADECNPKQTVQEIMDMPWTIVTKRVQDKRSGKWMIFGEIAEISEFCFTTEDTVSDCYRSLYEKLKDYATMCVSCNLYVSSTLDIEDIAPSAGIVFDK